MDKKEKSIKRHLDKAIGYSGKAHDENSKLVVHDDVTEEEIKAIRAELGDCFWQLNGICSVLGWNANSICQENLDKLASRKDRGKIDGNGDFF